VCFGFSFHNWLGKRGRVSDANPFMSSSTPSLMTQADTELVKSVFEDSVKEPKLDMATWFADMPAEKVLEHLALMKHGKQNVDVKLKTIADSFKKMSDFDLVVEKFKNSKEALMCKLCAELWKMGKVPGDDRWAPSAFRLALVNIYKAKGGADVDML
jgi:hypothetical protein